MQGGVLLKGLAPSVCRFERRQPEVVRGAVDHGLGVLDIDPDDMKVVVARADPRAAVHEDADIPGALTGEHFDHLKSLGREIGLGPLGDLQGAIVRPEGRGRLPRRAFPLPHGRSGVSFEGDLVPELRFVAIVENRGLQRQDRPERWKGRDPRFRRLELTVCDESAPPNKVGVLVQDRVENGLVVSDEVEFSHNGCVRVVHSIQKTKGPATGKVAGPNVFG